jgi:hypothetical protein
MDLLINGRFMLQCCVGRTYCTMPFDPANAQLGLVMRTGGGFLTSSLDRYPMTYHFDLPLVRLIMRLSTQVLGGTYPAEVGLS